MSASLFLKPNNSRLDITAYIRELILMNECVILRGIGGFETSYKKAVLRKDKKIIVPPSKQIHFQPEWIMDNAVLENHLAKSLGVSKAKASEYIDNYVQEFHNTLHEKGSVTLEGIGEFTLGKDKRILFRELEDANYLADSFGLDILDIETDTEKKPEVPVAELKPLEPAPRRLTGWYIAIGVLLLLISVTFIILISGAKEVSLFHPNSDTKTDDEIVVFGPSTDSKTDFVSRAVEQAIDQSTRAQNALAIDNEQASVSKNNITYYLVAGSFKTTRNAEIMQEQLIRKGFSAGILPTGNSQYRVIVGKYYEHHRAIEELRRIRTQLDQSVWLLEFQEN